MAVVPGLALRTVKPTGCRRRTSLMAALVRGRLFRRCGVEDRALRVLEREGPNVVVCSSRTRDR